MAAHKPPLTARERHLRARAAGLQYALEVTERSIERARANHDRVKAELRDAREEFAALRAQHSEAS